MDKNIITVSLKFGEMFVDHTEIDESKADNAISYLENMGEFRLSHFIKIAKSDKTRFGNTIKIFCG